MSKKMRKWKIEIEIIDTAEFSQKDLWSFLDVIISKAFSLLFDRWRILKIRRIK